MTFDYEHQVPPTPLAQLADTTLEAFVKGAEEMGDPINRAAFFIVSEKREAMTAGYNFDQPDEMLAFLISYARQLGEALGVQVAVIYPDSN